jgi:hypothetical protein
MSSLIIIITGNLFLITSQHYRHLTLDTFLILQFKVQVKEIQFKSKKMNKIIIKRKCSAKNKFNIIAIIKVIHNTL